MGFIAVFPGSRFVSGTPTGMKRLAANDPCALTKPYGLP